MILAFEQNGIYGNFASVLVDHRPEELFASIPDIHRKERRVSLSGELPQHTDEFQGCVFHTRCPHACERCRQEVPQMREIAPGHFSACHFAEQYAK